MEKQTLKRIAKIWASGILRATDQQQDDSLLTVEEHEYVLKEVHNIADIISKDLPNARSLHEAVSFFYEVD